MLSLIILNLYGLQATCNAILCPLYYETIEAEVSCYTNQVAETDESPDITASGERVYVGGLAQNGLSFGTLVVINGKVYQVNDRMNAKYGGNHFDIFMWDYDFCIKWGRQKLKVKIIK